jgi:hypothetical protein
MAADRHLFVNEPDKDYTRLRKLSFSEVIKTMIAMGGSTLGTELTKYFNFDVDAPSISAFSQQRNKITSNAFETLFHDFTNDIHQSVTFKNYHVFAVDGSGVGMPYNPKDETTFVRGYTFKGYNSLHLNAMYDIETNLYVDVLIQPKKQQNEYSALVDMVNRSKFEKVIVLADRGYESYNNLAHIQEKGWKYLIRAKDITSNGMLSVFDLPKDGEFDEIVETIITKKQTKETLTNTKKYRKIPYKSPFDFLSKRKPFYPINFRVVRLKLADGKYESLITNLNRVEFSTEEIKELYRKRWGIETSFRTLKYSAGLNNIHSRIMSNIVKEIYARLIAFNFSQSIIMNTKVTQTDTKHEYVINQAFAFNICIMFLLPINSESPPDVEGNIKKNLSAVRKGRNFPRSQNKKQNFVGHGYRYN